MSVEDQVRQRTARVCFLMIFGVVLLYFPSFFALAEPSNGPFALAPARLQLAVLPCTLPVLVLIAGYLLLCAALNKDLRGLAKNQSKDGLVSFLFFNFCDRNGEKLIHRLYKSGAHDSFSNRNLFLGKC